MAEYEERIIIEKRVDNFALLVEGWEWALRAANRSPSTLESYMETVRFFRAFLRSQGMPQEPHAIAREHVEAYMIHLLTTPNARTGQPVKPATCHKRYRALQQFFKWLVEEGEIKGSPMERMKPPLLPEQPPQTLTEAQITALLRACEGRDYFARRDLAIIRTLLDTGMRVSELVGMDTGSVDWEQGVIMVMGKGNRPRACAFGNKTGSALKSYLRARAMHRGAGYTNAFWLGRVKPITRSGVLQVLEKRGNQAKIGKPHPHQFRHNFAASWLKAGGTETGLMRLAGWKSRSMVNRYTASAQDQLAQEEHRRLRPGDKL